MQRFALLSYGYFPFFLLTASWAVFSLFCWMLFLKDHDVLASCIDPFFSTLVVFYLAIYGL